VVDRDATKFKVHSIRKSFLSALYGIAVAHGQINLDATREQLGIDDNEPSLTPEEKQARVIDLLKARSGIYHAALYETPTLRAEKPPRGSHPPRSFWSYNLWWVAVNGNHYPNVDLPDGSFSAWGAGGHFIAVIPAFNIVVVHRVNTDDPAKKVTLDQFGELLRLVLAAKDK
jgi:CubicO group peptidase (beta-lactamase class C family)